MSDTDLDMSWIQEYSRMHSIQQIINKEEIDQITIKTIYMNEKQEITKIMGEMIDLSVINTIHKGITKEQLSNIILQRKDGEQTNCKLFDIVLYSIDLEPKDIQRYVNGECGENSKLTSINTVKDIIIAPSLFIFHSLHTIFLFFSERKEIQPIKSIIKTGGINKPKHTKKVRIVIPCDDFISTAPTIKKTRKRWY